MKEQLIKCLAVLHEAFNLGLKKGAYDSTQVKDIIIAHETLQSGIGQIKEIEQPKVKEKPKDPKDKKK